MQHFVLVIRFTLHTSHPHGITSTKCRIDRVISPDDGHIVAGDIYRKEIKILRKIVHQDGFIYKISVTRLQKIQRNLLFYRHFCNENSAYQDFSAFKFAPGESDIAPFILDTTPRNTEKCPMFFLSLVQIAAHKDRHSRHRN